MVVLGSLGSDRWIWHAPARDHRVVTVDHNGHGGSDVVPGPCTVEDSIPSAGFVILSPAAPAPVVKMSERATGVLHTHLLAASVSHA